MEQTIFTLSFYENLGFTTAGKCVELYTCEGGDCDHDKQSVVIDSNKCYLKLRALVELAGLVGLLELPQIPHRITKMSIIHPVTKTKVDAEITLDDKNYKLVVHEYLSMVFKHHLKTLEAIVSEWYDSYGSWIKVTTKAEPQSYGESKVIKLIHIIKPKPESDGPESELKPICSRAELLPLPPKLLLGLLCSKHYSDFRLGKQSAKAKWPEKWAPNTGPGTDDY